LISSLCARNVEGFGHLAGKKLKNARKGGQSVDRPPVKLGRFFVEEKLIRRLEGDGNVVSKHAVPVHKPKMQKEKRMMRMKRRKEKEEGYNVRDVEVSLELCLPTRGPAGGVADIDAGHQVDRLRPVELIDL
jgi:hypothetical protein